MKIAAVIVTFNRLECLKKALPLYTSQTYLPACMIVVDNHSTDGTAEYLAQWKAEASPVEKIVLTLPENTGGAGGFHAGMERALQTDCDWVWVADDDAYPRKDALEKLQSFVHDGLPEKDGAAAVCTSVYENGEIALEHRREKKSSIADDRAVPVSQYAKRYFELDSFSFVGVMFPKSVLSKCGTPCADYFIYFDDTEYSIRVRKNGKIFCIPDAAVDHMSGQKSAAKTVAVTWREYYNTRNLLVTIKRYSGQTAFLFRACRRMLYALLTGNRQRIRLFWCAIRDAAHERMGINSVYRPGWKA